jgi:hypothetical protein
MVVMRSITAPKGKGKISTSQYRNTFVAKNDEQLLFTSEEQVGRR